MATASLQRRSVMRDIVRTAQQTGDTEAPWRAMGELGGQFVDEADILLEVHREWVRVLVARLHQREIVAERTPIRVRDLYTEVSTDHPTLRAILDANEAHPVLWEPTAQEHSLLARIAGLAPAGTHPEVAATIGRTLVSQHVPAQRR